MQRVVVDSPVGITIHYCRNRIYDRKHSMPHTLFQKYAMSYNNCLIMPSGIDPKHDYKVWKHKELISRDEKNKSKPSVINRQVVEWWYKGRYNRSLNIQN